MAGRRRTGNPQDSKFDEEFPSLSSAAQKPKKDKFPPTSNPNNYRNNAPYPDTQQVQTSNMMESQKSPQAQSRSPYPQPRGSPEPQGGSRDFRGSDSGPNDRFRLSGDERYRSDNRGSDNRGSDSQYPSRGGGDRYSNNRNDDRFQQGNDSESYGDRRPGRFQQQQQQRDDYGGNRRRFQDGPDRRYQNQRHIPDDAPKETGVIASIKDGFGFICCANRNVDSLFFHFSELVDRNTDVRQGDEVSFAVCVDGNSGRDKAGRVKILPRGSIQWTRTDGRGSRAGKQEIATVTELRENSGFLITPEGVEANFQKRDLVSDIPLNEGDLVECVITKERDKEGRDRYYASRVTPFSGATILKGIVEDVVEDPTARRKGQYKGVISLEQGGTINFKSAQVFSPGKKLTRLTRGDGVHIMSVSTSGSTTNPEDLKICSITLDAPSEEGLEQGVVSTIKDSYCFLRCTDRQDQLFLHVSEIAEDVNLKTGLELQFHVAKDGDRLCAFRATPLPEGTVQFTEVLPEEYQGTVSRELAEKQPSRDRKTMKRELVGEISADSETEPITFRDVDVFNVREREELVIGDVVSFQVQVYKPTKTRSATNIKLVQGAPGERGVVLCIAGPSNSPSPAELHTGRRGLIHSLQRPGNYLSFFTDEVEQPAGGSPVTVTAGDILEFNVRKGQATRVRPVVNKNKTDVVEPIETVDGTQRVKARVIHTPKPTDGHLTGHLALLGLQAEDNLNFFFEDVLPKQAAGVYDCHLRPGDIVECNLATHVKDPSVRRAVKVQFAPKRGLITALKDSGDGVIVLSEDVADNGKRGDRDREGRGGHSGERREELPFSVKDCVVVESGKEAAKPRRGDHVIVLEVTLDVFPKRRVTKFQPLSESEVQAPPPGVTRYAKGPPDGNQKGFAFKRTVLVK